ncbi:MAG: aldehyde dehydrogenase family protein [Rhodobacteraceae bacterium]|nr:aldehyde dehydrogenase family protein [Paracoccaceae bacterium]
MSDIEKIMETMDYGKAPEDPSAANAWLAAHPRLQHYINGAFKGDKSEGLAVQNPANGEALTVAPVASEALVDEAVKAARKAQPKWAALSGHQRAKYLYAISRLLQKRSRLFAVLESMDNGKPIRESRDADVPLVIRHFYHHAGWAEILDEELPGHTALGVCGQIIPWNFPLLMLAWKIAPALAAGNTIVLKPAEFTPITAALFAEICVEAGLPAGVVNIVFGAGETGAAISGHPDIDKVAFTGSSEVGKIIRWQTAGSGKKLSLELGGKSPFIVFEDADLDSAVEGVVDAIWFNQGQVCCAGSRLLVQEAVAEQFIAKLKARAEKLVVGDPLDKSVDVGAIVDQSQLETIQALVAQGQAEGAELWQSSCAMPNTGCFYPPSILSEVTSASTVVQQEIFGPVLTVQTFRTHAEAIQLANNTRYGLSASIWSETLSVALDAAARVKAGIIWVNGTNMFDAAAGFGGYGESGFGREGGIEGMMEYLADPAPTVKPAKAQTVDFSPLPTGSNGADAMDRTAKFYIGGKQARPDGAATYTAYSAKGKPISQAGLGSRKDVRNAVVAAVKAAGWSGSSPHLRAQILYYLAENLEARRDEFAERLALMTGSKGTEEVDLAIQRISFYAGYADKYDGKVHSTLTRHVTLAMNEPLGVMGIICPDEAPLLSMVSLLAPALAMGNRVVMLASQKHPLMAGDFMQVLETSDVPAGVVNLITGDHGAMAPTLADHDDVNALWNFGAASADLDARSAGNLKITWNSNADWANPASAQGKNYLRHATQVKNIWVPYGE